MSFHVGQKVVCVDASNWKNIGYLATRPVLNGVYHVRAIDEDWAHYGGANNPGLRLEEIRNRKDLWFRPGEISFSTSRFRPVTERKTDISVFTEIARDITERKPVKITERA